MNSRFPTGALGLFVAVCVIGAPNLARPTSLVQKFDDPIDPAVWLFTGGGVSQDETNGWLVLTSAVNDLEGSAFLRQPIDGTKFDASFKLYIGGGDGADGMTFAWVRGPEFLGGGGGGMGFFGLDGYAVKFDTCTGGISEPENYVAVVTGSDASNANGFFSNDAIPEIKDAGWFYIEIKFDNGHLQMWWSNESLGIPLTPVLDDTIPDYVGFDAYFGFTAAATGLYNNHFVDDFVLNKGATAPHDFSVYGEDTVTLTGDAPSGYTLAKWEQVAGTPAVTLTPTGDLEAQFVAPALEVGTSLTFRFTVDHPDEGTAFDDVNVSVRATNAPKLAPSNIHVLPLDAGTDGLGFRTIWDPLVDAELYEIGCKMGDMIDWLETIATTSHEVQGLTDGQARTITIRGRNKYGGSGDPAAIVEVSYTGMRNLARPAAKGGTSEPSGYVYAASHYAITGMNDIAYGDTNDSWNGHFKAEDYWGYLWGSDLFFDHVVYFTGNTYFDGGWWLDLRVEYTKDGGTTWEDVPIYEIYPAMRFTDEQTGKRAFTRYDLTIPTLRGNGIRVAGTPGGTEWFTSISELEIFGLQTQGPLVVQGLDGECPEGAMAFLEGTFTFSTLGTITSYQWTGPGGIEIVNPTSAVASFQAPMVSADTVYVFSLQASDGTNINTDADVRILVKNLVTTAVAGPDQSVEERTPATLDGSGSLTTTGNITYLWTQTGGTDVGVTGKTTATVDFTAPIIWGYEEPLTFRLNVNDGAGGMSSDHVVVRVRNALTWPAYPVTYPESNSYFQNMLHLGTNPTDRLMSPDYWGNMLSGFDPLESFGGVRNVRPYPGLAFDFTGQAASPNLNPLVWTQQFSSSGIFENGTLDHFQMHYSVYILSPEDRDVRWHGRNDDLVRVFCNGATVLSRDRWDVNVEQVEDGLVADGRGLRKGLNCITGWHEEWTGDAMIAIGITDLSDQRFDDLLYSFGPSVLLTDAYASRSLPTSYEPGATVNVDVAMKVNPSSTLSSVIVSETIPAGIPEANVSAPGASVAGGKITWSLTGTNVKNQSLTYSLTVPTEGVTDVMHFVGTLTFGTTVADISGEDKVYPVPAAPKNLTVEMLQAAHLSWSAPGSTGVVAYNVYRSVNGGAREFLGKTSSTSYTDKWVSAGNNYTYQVSAVNQVGDEGPASCPTAQVSITTMDIRESEDFNYGGGLYPGHQNCPAANEAPSATDLDAQYDFFHPHEWGFNVYRPTNAPPQGLGIVRYLPADDPEVFVTRIAWIDIGSWYRYTYDVTQAGWIKLEFRLAGSGVLAAYWDETLVGTVSYKTGNPNIFTWVLMEDQIQTTAGVHTLRVESIAGGVDLDKHAILWSAPAPARAGIWADNFDSYATTAEVFSQTNGGWTRGSTTGTAGAWTLWDTGTDLGNESGNIRGMEGNYMVSDSDLSGAGVLLDEEILTPEVDGTGWTKLRLNFNYNYRIYDDPDHTQDYDVDIRVFDSATGWSGWTNLFHLDTSLVPTTLDPPMLSGTQLYDLSAYDGKRIQLKFRFHNAEYDYWAAFDNVLVSGVQEAVEIPLPDIALAAGNVTVSWDAFAGQYTVEYTADLKGTWTQTAGPITRTSFSEAMRSDRTGYYRILGQ